MLNDDFDLVDPDITTNAPVGLDDNDSLATFEDTQGAKPFLNQLIGGRTVKMVIFVLIVLMVLKFIF